MLRVPYPLGFYAKWIDGRIDDPAAGWKGKAPLVNRQQPGAVPYGDRQGHAARS